MKRLHIFLLAKVKKILDFRNIFWHELIIFVITCFYFYAIFRIENLTKRFNKTLILIQGCGNAETAWEKYHNTIEGIIDAFEGQRGLLLDFHGQVMKISQAEQI